MTVSVFLFIAGHMAGSVLGAAIGTYFALRVITKAVRIQLEEDAANAKNQNDVSGS